MFIHTFCLQIGGVETVNNQIIEASLLAHRQGGFGGCGRTARTKSEVHYV